MGWGLYSCVATGISLKPDFATSKNQSKNTIPENGKKECGIKHIESEMIWRVQFHDFRTKNVIQLDLLSISRLGRIYRLPASSSTTKRGLAELSRA